MDKISDLKNIVINTLDTNKAQDIVTIDLKDKSSMADLYDYCKRNLLKTHSIFIRTSFRKVKR